MARVPEAFRSDQSRELYRQDFRAIGKIIEQDADEILARWYERAQQEQIHGGTTERQEMLNELRAQVRSMGKRLQEQTEEFLEHPEKVARAHGVTRWRSGWSVAEVVADYQILHQITLEHIGKKHKERLTYREAMVIAMLFDMSIENAVEAFAEEVGKRNTEINDELRRSNHDLENFANIASHDLQEPLRMVTGFLGLLRDRSSLEFDEQSAEWLRFAVAGADRMSKLLRGLLAYARIGARGAEPTAVDANEALRLAMDNLRIAIAEAGATVASEHLPKVLFDQAQLMQVFQNLIANAVKFRRPDESPHVNISCQEREGEWLFRVADNGIGIPPHQKDRVFEMFFQADRTSNQTGTGIGLAVCKRVVERHGGRIWVESEQGKGSTFCFTASPVKQ